MTLTPRPCRVYSVTRCSILDLCFCLSYPNDYILLAVSCKPKRKTMVHVQYHFACSVLHLGHCHFDCPDISVVSSHRGVKTFSISLTLQLMVVHLFSQQGQQPEPEVKQLPSTFFTYVPHLHSLLVIFFPDYVLFKWLVLFLSYPYFLCYYLPRKYPFDPLH